MRPIVLATVVLAASAAAVFLARSAEPFYPVSDIALTELFTREAAHGRLIVGPYSRFGWHHPGPTCFYLLAPFYAAGGGHTAALDAGAFALSLVALAIVAWIGQRYVSATFSIAVIAGIFLVTARLPPLLVSSWNAHVVVLPAAAFMVTAAAVGVGHDALLPLLAGLASFLAQTDVALVPFVAVIGAAAAALGAGSIRPRTIAWTAVTVAALWALPLGEQLTNQPGNVVRLWRFFVAGAGGRLGTADAAAIWSNALTAPLRPGFILARGSPIEPDWSTLHVALACVLVALVAIAAGVAIRRGARPLARLALLALAASLVTLWSASRIEGGVSDHQSFWFAIVGVLDAAAIVAVWTPSARPRGARAITGMILAIILVVGLRQMDIARHGGIPVTDSAPSAPNFAASIRRYLERTKSQRPLFRLDERQWGLGVAILLQLDRAGVAFAVENDWMPMFPDRFRETGQEDAELTLAARGQRLDLAGRPGNETVDESTFIHVEAVRLSSRVGAPRP